MRSPEKLRAWADLEVSFADALEHLVLRSQMACDKPLYWKTYDVGAVRVLAAKAKELGLYSEGGE